MRLGENFRKVRYDASTIFDRRPRSRWKAGAKIHEAGKKSLIEMPTVMTLWFAITAFELNWVST